MGAKPFTVPMPPISQVSVESFRAIMEEIQAQRIAEMADTER